MNRPEVDVTGHFGEWLQGRLGLDGPVVLVTLSCPALTVQASARDAVPAPGLFPEERLRDFLARLGLPAACLPKITCSMPPGAGAGASTATLIALARWAGYGGAPEPLARACLAIEGATDPLMWPGSDRLLWASRGARVIRWMAPPPACEIVGGFWGAPVPTDPRDRDFDDITDLAGEWARATKTGNLARAAAVATLSAERCTSRRGPGDPMAGLARELGALGHLRAHTGSARGLVFAPGTVPGKAMDALTEAGLTGVLRFRTGGA